MAKIFYVLWGRKQRSCWNQIKDIKAELELGHIIVLGGIGELTLGEDADGIKQIHFAPSQMLAGLETPQCLTAKRTKCACRLAAGDVPPGMDPDDVMLDCENDTKCPKKQGGTK